MMFVKSGLGFIALLSCLLVELNIAYANSSAIADKDPFRSLGIPDLNPKALLEEINSEDHKEKDKSKTLPQLKTIDDLPAFLKNSKMNEEEGIKVLTRFLIQDDFTLKKYGVVYDQTGFDGISSGERIAPVGTEERLSQRARSAANIWFKQKFPKLDYDAYGADNLMDEIVPNWRVFKVLMIGKNGENTFVKVCLPLDESETALCSDKDDLCGPRAEYVEKEKKKNEDYIEKIRTNNFFKKKNINTVKLLPGEKLIAKEGDKKIVIDSATIKNKYEMNNQNGFYNPPSIDSMNNGDPLLNAYRMKNNLRGQPGFMNGMNMGGFNMNRFNGQGMQMPNLQGMPFNPQGMASNLNQFNTLNNNLNSNSNSNTMNNAQNPNTYNFKQKELTTNPNSVNGSAPNPIPSLNGATPNSIDNNQLMNDLMQMKSQLNEMMLSIKQKDEIINQQNMKLSQFTGGMNQMNMGMNMYQNIPNGFMSNNMSNVPLNIQAGQNNLQSYGNQIPLQR